jgi:putative SOS response-associated peptidase YedK
MDATSKMMWLHDRMPLLLKDDAAVDAWLVRAGATLTV